MDYLIHLFVTKKIFGQWDFINIRITTTEQTGKKLYINGNSAPANQSLFGIWGDGNEIFICDVYNGIIYHGK